MNDLRVQLRLLTEARRDRLFILARSAGLSPSDWLRSAIDRAGCPRNDEERDLAQLTMDELLGPPRGR